MKKPCGLASRLTRFFASIFEKSMPASASRVLSRTMPRSVGEAEWAVDPAGAELPGANSAAVDPEDTVCTEVHEVRTVAATPAAATNRR